MARLTEGEQVPDFTLEGPTGPLALSEALQNSERGVVVYFYPRAETPGCTGQACDFRDNLQALTHAGFTVVGISPDTPQKLAAFAQNHELPYTLLSDPEHRVMEQWGAWGEKMNYGKTVTGVIRSTVVVNKNGAVHLALYNVRAKGHVARLLRLLNS